MQSEQIDKLITALSKAQGQLDNAKKNSENTFFKKPDGTKSKYSDLAECISTAKPVLSENGLAVIQTTEINESGGVVLVTMLSHSTGQWIKGYYPISPTKGDPQAYGSAMTYARRYAYCAIIGLASEDDDGKEASSGHNENLENIIKNIANSKNMDELKKIFGNSYKSFQNENDKQILSEAYQSQKGRLEGMQNAAA